MKQAKKFISNNYILIFLGIIFILLLWTLISMMDGNGNFLFPNPIDAFIKIGELLGSSYTYQSIGFSFLRTLIGFLFSLIITLILSLFVGFYPKLQHFFKPLMIVLKCVPTAALVYFFLAKSGSFWAPVFIVSILAIPIIYESVIGGLNELDKEIIDEIKIDTTNRVQSTFQVKLPLSIPYLFIGITSSFGLSLKTEIMAEIITGDTNYGMGAMISAYRNLDPTDLSPIFAIAVIAIIIMIIITLISTWLERIIRNRLL